MTRLARGALTLALAAAPLAAARDVPPAVFPLRDDAGALDAATAAAVRRVCVDLERDTGAELGVLIVGSAGGEDPRAFGLRVFNAWGVGKRGLDNGVLLLVAMQDRRVELIAGTGYEALFTPAASSALLQEAVVSRMRAGQPGEAVLAGARAVAARVREHERERAAGGPARPPGRTEPVAFGGAPSNLLPEAPEASPAQQRRRRRQQRRPRRPRRPPRVAARIPRWRRPGGGASSASSWSSCSSPGSGASRSSSSARSARGRWPSAGRASTRRWRPAPS
ncbi:MAG: TPM domain-containing protein [Planctomycetes bacterium]|nr:TPM domain-containing protein [Planctomycetota bacterium]